MTTSDPASAAELQQEIEQTREHLGQTVDELAAKADVKSRAQAKTADVKSRARAKTAEVKRKAADASGQVRRSQVVQRRWPLAAVAVGVILIGSIAVWRRRKT
jgi:hypothetical protein